MATEPGDADTDRWLDGLAGRPGASATHADGERLRRALQSEESKVEVSALSWAEIEHRATAGNRAQPAGTPSPPSPAAHPVAANESLWRPWQGWAAAVLVAACVALVMQQREPEASLRGSGSAAATWVVDDPQAAANDLAGELRGLGAQVQQQAADGQVVLTLQASGPAADAVNRRLAALETALDSAGSLTLRIRGR